MRFALDYDGTFTEDNALWASFVRLAIERGHTVTFVTARSDDGSNADIETDAQLLGIRIVYTSGDPKSDKYTADVWIDDNPLWIPSYEAMELSVRLKASQT